MPTSNPLFDAIRKQFKDGEVLPALQSLKSLVTVDDAAGASTSASGMDHNRFEEMKKCFKHFRKCSRYYKRIDGIFMIEIGGEKDLYSVDSPLQMLDSSQVNDRPYIVMYPDTMIDVHTIDQRENKIRITLCMDWIRKVEVGEKLENALFFKSFSSFLPRLLTVCRIRFQSGLHIFPSDHPFYRVMEIRSIDHTCDGCA